MAERKVNIRDIVLGALEQCRKDGYAVMRWIPCRERLPEYGVDVLVYVKPWEDNIQVAHIQYDGIMWEMSDGEFYFSKSDVTHWMPLPEPPESEVQK